MHSKINRTALLTNCCFVFALLIGFSNCKKPESPEPTLPEYTPPATAFVENNNYILPPVAFKTSVQGIVTDISGNPVAGAVVSTTNAVVTTDEFGMFEFLSAAFTRDFCYIKAVKDGYFCGSTTVYSEKEKNCRAEIVLLKRDNIISFQANEGRDIVLNNGAGVKFNPGTIKNSNGTLHKGNVKVSIVHIDPADENFSRMIPGGDLRAFTNEGDEVQLYSYGMLNIELHDDAGNLLNLADNAFATLTFPVPAAMLAGAPATIPLWYFDENKGIWIEEGSAKLNGNKYIGYVTHFTPHNADARSGPSRPNPIPPPPPSPKPAPKPPPPPATITGKLTDCKGKAIPYGKVRVGQTMMITDADGNFSRLMPLGDYTLDVYDDILNKFIGINKTVSLAVSNTKVNAGAIVKPCRALITGRIKDCDNTNFNGYAQIKYQGKNIVSIITDGWLRAEVPAGGMDATISFYKPSTGILYTKSIVLPPTVNDEIKFESLKVCYEGIVHDTPKLNFNYRYDTSATEIVVNFSTFKFAETHFARAEWRTHVKFIDSLHPQDTVIISFLGPDKGLKETDLIYPQNPNSPNIRIYLGSKNVIMQSATVIIDVQEYGDVGQWVAGSFSGRFSIKAVVYSGPNNSPNNSLPNSLAVDVNGLFAAQRIPDKW